MSRSVRAERSAKRVLEGRGFGRAAVLVRQGDGSRDAFGEWVPAAEARTGVRLVDEPVRARDEQVLRDVLPAGARLRNCRRFYVRGVVDPLRTGAGPADGDRIEIDGDSWRAVRCEVWTGYTMVIGVREDL